MWFRNFKKQLNRIEIKLNRLCTAAGIDTKKIDKSVGGTIPPDDDE